MFLCRCLHEVEIDVVTDRSTLKPRTESVAGLIASADISPSGKRVVIEARGDLFTVPAENGVVRNITRSSGTADRTPAWSPDGRWIACFSDESGEYELTIGAADGSGDPRRLTTMGEGFRYTPYWSPDRKKLAFIDQAMKTRIFDLDSETLTDVDQGLWMLHGGLANFQPSWSSDGRWLAYSPGLENRHNAVFLFDTESNRRHQVTSGFYGELAPAFDPDGKPVPADQPPAGTHLQRLPEHLHLRQHHERHGDLAARRRAVAAGTAQRRGGDRRGLRGKRGRRRGLRRRFGEQRRRLEPRRRRRAVSIHSWSAESPS